MLSAVVVRTMLLIAVRQVLAMLLWAPMLLVCMPHCVSVLSRAPPSSTLRVRLVYVRSMVVPLLWLWALWSGSQRTGHGVV